MLHGTVKYFLRSLIVVAVTLLAGAALFAWRLSQGPLDLQPAKPYLEEALSASDGSYRVSLDSTVVTWGGWHRLLDLRARGINVYGADGAVLASVPEISVSLSGSALLTGVIAPRDLELIGPQLRLVRTGDGGLSLGIGGGGQVALTGPAGSPETPGGLGVDILHSHLDNVSILAGSLSFEDEELRTTWRFSGLELQLSRLDDNIVAEADMLFETPESPARLNLLASIGADAESGVARLTVDEVIPAKLADLTPALADLAMVGLPVSGVAQFSWQRGTGVSEVSVDLAGGAGFLDLPQPIATRYDIASGHLRASIDPKAERLVVEELYIDLDGPRLSLTGLLEREESGGLVLRADANAKDVPVDSLHRFWPEDVAPAPREWIVENLDDGIVREATMTLAGRVPAGKGLDAIEIEALQGALSPQEMTVHYLRPMPPARDVWGRAVYDADSMTITVEEGQYGDIRVTGGQIELSKLNSERPLAEIALDVEGPLEQALALLDEEPLAYTSKLGLATQNVRGFAKTRLSLALPLLKDVRLDDVEVRARSTVSRVALPPVFADVGLTDGNVELDVDSRGMDAVGPIALAGIPVHLEWRENFGDDPPFRSRYRLKGTLDDAQRQRLGLVTAPFQAPFLSGPVNANLLVTAYDDGSEVLDGDIDLASAAMSLPGVGWSKEEGLPASASVTAEVGDGRLIALRRFVVSDGQGLEIRGSAGFDTARGANLVFDRFRFGRTDVSGEVGVHSDRSIVAAVRGKSFDAAGLLRNAAVGDVRSSPGLKPPGEVRLAFGVDRLWLAEGGYLDSVNGAFEHDGALWRRLVFSGLTHGGGRVEGKMSRRRDGLATMQAYAADAGTLLAALGLMDDMRGGELELTGRIAPGGKWAEGRLGIDDFRLVGAPLLAQLLNLASVAGLIDVLQGEGLLFRRLDAPFVVEDGLLRFKDATAWGVSLGITANGNVDLASEQVEVEGTLVPMYLINSVLGHIPLFGLLVSPEKGGGLFAATFGIEGDLDDPNLYVNPLAALTPGFLRRLFPKVVDTED